MPIGASALRAVEMVNGATLKVYPGADHGIPTTHKAAFNADLLTFLNS